MGLRKCCSDSKTHSTFSMKVSTLPGPPPLQGAQHSGTRRGSFNQPCSTFERSDNCAVGLKIPGYMLDCPIGALVSLLLHMDLITFIHLFANKMRQSHVYHLTTYKLAGT